eukprot:g24821.t1
MVRRLCVAWWAAFVIKAAGFSCTQDANKKAVISETFRHLHDFTAQVIGICKNATTDVYQRFSGYAARHRRALFCERVLAVLDSLQAAATAIICTEQAAAKPKEAIGRMQDLLLELKFLLQDLNAYGDGSLLEVVEQHLSAMANSINHADSGAGAAATVLTAADTLSQLTNFIFEQLSDAVTYNVARLGVGGAKNATVSLSRFLSSLDGFPATVSLDLLRAPSQETQSKVSRSAVDLGEACVGTGSLCNLEMILRSDRFRQHRPLPVPPSPPVSTERRDNGTEAPAGAKSIGLVGGVMLLINNLAGEVR